MEHKKYNCGKKYRAFYFRGIEIETPNQHLGESQRRRVKSGHNTNQRIEEDCRKRGCLHLEEERKPFIFYFEEREVICSGGQKEEKWEN